MFRAKSHRLLVPFDGTFKIQAKRLNKFDDKVKLAVEGLPPGVTAGEVAPVAKGTEAKLTLNAAADARTTSIPPSPVRR